jgi:hypothetical protein
VTGELAHLDHVMVREWMLGSKPHRLVLALAVDDREAADELLGLGERSVAQHGLAVTNSRLVFRRALDAVRADEK